MSDLRKISVTENGEWLWSGLINAEYIKFMLDALDILSDESATPASPLNTESKGGEQ